MGRKERMFVKSKNDDVFVVEITDDDGFISFFCRICLFCWVG